MILLTSLFLFSNGELSAQELNAKVTVNHNQIQGTDASVFENLQQTLEQFINTRQWTHYQFQRNERITVTLILLLANMTQVATSLLVLL